MKTIESHYVAVRERWRLRLWMTIVFTDWKSIRTPLRFMKSLLEIGR